MRLHPIGRLFFISILAVVLASCASEPKKTAARAVKNIPLKPGAVTQAELDRRPAAVRKRVEAAIDKALETKKYGELEALLEKGEWTIYDLKKVYDKKDAVLAEMLLRYGCVDVEARYEDIGSKERGSTLLLLAAGRNDTGFVKLFLQYGYDPNTKDKLGMTPLFRLVFNSYSGYTAASTLGNRMETARCLLANGVDLRTKLEAAVQALINNKKISLTGMTIRDFTAAAEKARDSNAVVPETLPPAVMAELEGAKSAYSGRKKEIDEFLDLNAGIAEKLDAEFVRPGKVSELKKNAMMYSLWTDYTANKKTRQSFLDADRDQKILSRHYKGGREGVFRLSGPVQPADREVLIATLKKYVQIQEAAPTNELISLMDDSGALGALSLKYAMKPPRWRPSGASIPPVVSADMKIIPGRGFAGCGVGDPMKTALDRFGPPEAALRTNVDFYYLEYPSLGVRISASLDTETLIGGSYFYRSPRDEQFRGTTEDGIDKYSSVQDVIDLYGKPQRDSGYIETSAQGDFAGSRERRLEYPSRGISFVFHNGRLSFFIVYQARGK